MKKPARFSFDFMSPKKIILNAIKDKLEGTGIVNMILLFNVPTDKYHVVLAKADNSTLKLDIEKDEITMIKKMFVSKIEAAYKKKSDKEIKDVIIKVDLITDEIKIFIEDINNRIEKFDYKF